MNAAFEEAWRCAWQRLRGGDQSAWQLLLPALQPMVYSIGLRMLGSRAAAEDLSQEVFMQMHLHQAQIGNADHLRHWLCRTAAHRAIDQLRRQRHWRNDAEAVDVETLAADAPAVDGDPALERRLRSLLLQLPPVPRAVVLLRFQEDLEPAGIAAALSLPVNTVKSHLRRSLALLRGRMA